MFQMCFLDLKTAYTNFILSSMSGILVFSLTTGPIARAPVLPAIEEIDRIIVVLVVVFFSTDNFRLFS